MDRPITSSYTRKSDGGKARSYMCSNVKHSTGLCDLPTIDAGIEAPIIEHLQGYFLDFEKFADRVVGLPARARRGVNESYA